jgi:hypothetical protein
LVATFHCGNLLELGKINVSNSRPLLKQEARMRRTTFWLVVPTLVIAGFAYAQQGDETKKSAEASEAEVRLMDGSIVRMQILQDKIDVQTAYGKLTVPVKQIARIDFGVHLPSTLEPKIVQAIEQLDNENYKVRETAVKKLIEWGPHAYPLVYRATKADAPEVAKRASLTLEKIRAKHPSDKLRLRDEDIIVTTKFTMVGRIMTPAFKVKSDTFGELNLELAKLRAIRWFNTPLETEVNVDAEKHGSASNQWMDTGVEIQTGGRLVIVASGNVNLWPQGGNNSGYLSTPKGYSGANGPGPHRPGTLIAKIGEEGPAFAVGERYEGAPARDGKLYIHIVPSPWNCPSSGSYQVKITPRSDMGE